jgi:aspartate carbamoyltransferase catalytic subunit
MPTSKSSLINLCEISKNKIESLFEKSLGLKKNHSNRLTNLKSSAAGLTASLLFFEPSTRTRFSFEAAAVRAGLHPMILSGSAGTSLEKGETVFDTIKNIEAMRPDLFIIRCDGRTDLQKISESVSVPIINAGWGQHGHPTQALLDALSLFERWQSLDKMKVLFVGDIRHSRVVASHFELARILNYQIGICAPTNFLPESSIKNSFIEFATLQAGLQWADAVMALRVQKERHDGSSVDLNMYQKMYGLNQTVLKSLKDSSLIMHPGPINYGIEIEAEVTQDKRAIILSQVENGVFLREALIRQILEGQI